jgi:tetratricopeptide (TPR) repeat protein
LHSLAESDPDEVMRRCYALLDANPDDSLALMLMGAIYVQAEKFGLAVNVFKRVVDISPRAEAWSHLGLSYLGLKHPKARQALETAWGLKQSAANTANLACMCLEEQDYKGAVSWAEKALKLAPDNVSAHTSHGMASLALGNWKEGWEGFSYAVGGKFRKETQYQEEPRWDGSPGKSLIVYGEQGLGDEVMYASCVPDVIARSKEVVLECDPRLAGLFKRSFPKAHVYGTRRLPADWLDKHAFDARCPIGQLPEHFRQSAESFPGTPYLTADPDRRIQWRALFDSWGKKPKIGLCWSGGSRHNNPHARDVGLEGFRELIESVDADWVSLQYKDPTREIEESGLPVKHYARATLTADYDDTAGLVAELDLVIGPHTSVHHLAGALGVPSLILVPKQSIWIYQQPTLPWYGTATLVKQVGMWKETIATLLSHPALCGLRPA